MEQKSDRREMSAKGDNRKEDNIADENQPTEQNDIRS